MLSQSLLSEIRDRLPISVYIGEKIPLKKAGRNFKGVCPFHNEKTPSFMVSDEKQIYHCFGCGEGGDIFSFTMKYDGVSFMEAVEQLAQRTGVEIPKEKLRSERPDEDAARKKKLLLRVNQIAMEWFRSRLHETAFGEQVRNYLISRGIKNEFFTQLNLGAAEKNWNALSEHLVGRKVPLELAQELGLIRKRDGRDGYYDFFRGRLMFPIASPKGDIIAFGGRTLDAEDEAKYLNSSDSTIFHKSMNVYGLNLAAEHIRRADEAIIVEGYMDVIGLMQAGVSNVVAPLGTALTSGHVRTLSRSTRNMVVVFDGDEAGVRAAIRSLPIFLELGLMPRVVALPKGEDPDTFVRSEGAESFKTKVTKAIPLFEYFVDQTVKAVRPDSVGKVAAMERITPLLKQVSDPVAQGIYRSSVAQKLGISESIVRDALAGKKDGVRAIAKSDSRHKVFVPSAERLFVELLVQHPKLAKDAFESIKPDEIEDDFNRMITTLIYDETNKNGRFDFASMTLSNTDAEVEREMRAMAMAPERASEEEADEAIKDCIRAIKDRPRKSELIKLNELIRLAEKEGNDTQLSDLLRRKKELVKEKHTQTQ